MLLIDDLLMLPVRGFKGLFIKIAEMAEDEFTDEGKIKDELMRMHMLYETDQITLEEHTHNEKQLMKRLEKIRQYKEKKLKE